MPGQGHLAHMIGACGIRGSSPFRRFHDFKDSVPKIISLPGPSGVLRIFSAAGPVRTAFFFYPPQGASIPESMIIIPYFHSLRTVTAGIACGWNTFRIPHRICKDFYSRHSNSSVWRLLANPARNSPGASLAGQAMRSTMRTPVKLTALGSA